MKKFTSYLTMLLSFWFILNAGKSNAQCIANFNYSLNANGNVTFSANCTSANSVTTQYYWQFGNSTTFTSTGSPIAQVTYTANGTYTVNLFYYTPTTCSNTVSYTINITNVTCNLVADYNYTLSSNGQVNFSSTSTGTNSGTSYIWTFGDFTPDGYGNPISHTYNTNGVYTATLMAYNNTVSCGSGTVHTFNITNALNCTLNASFTYTQGSNGQVNFTSTSTGTTATTIFTWNYGDASTNTGASTSHTYAANGFYNAYLILQDGPCIDSIGINILVNTLPCGLTAGFSYTQGANGLVNFASTSTGTTGSTTYIWQYGDATPNGSGVAPSHTYNNNGVYTATLTAINNSATCTSSIIHTFTITNALNCTLNASFSAMMNANGLVNFTSTSTGTSSSTTYVWHYGDATSGTGVTSSHTYANGWFLAYLVLTDGMCTDSVSSVITVTNVPCSLNASFNYTVGSSGTVNFISTSTGTTSMSTYTWNYGDATTGYGDPVSHAYTTSGTYIATLTVSNGTISSPCVDTFTQSIVVPCVANSNFSLVPTATAQVWNAIPWSTSNVVAATWSWGDNSTSNTLYTSHTYSASGTYSICLSVTVTCGGVSTTCVNQYIYRSSQQAMQMVQINVVPSSMPTGIVKNNIEATDYLVYPNPNNGQFELKLNGSGNEMAKIKVYSIIGNLVYETEAVNDNSVKAIDLNNISNGVYFIKINANNKEYTKKIIVSK